MSDSISRSRSLALKLFAIYLVLYVSYVLTNAFWPQAMEIQFLGINFAIWSGFGLIIGAFLLAMIYGWFAEPKSSSPDSQ